jgi:diketogulonate reductase-like aldo/keto reductase
MRYLELTLQYGIGSPQRCCLQKAMALIGRVGVDLAAEREEFQMRYNQLGNTGMFVSELCLGTMTFGEAGTGGTWGAIADVDQDAANKIVEKSIAAGVNFIDTADVYSFGASETILGQALQNLEVPRKDVVIATKV